MAQASLAWPASNTPRRVGHARGTGRFDASESTSGWFSSHEAITLHECAPDEPARPPPPEAIPPPRETPRWSVPLFRSPLRSLAFAHSRRHAPSIRRKTRKRCRTSKRACAASKPCSASRRRRRKHPPTSPRSTSACACWSKNSPHNRHSWRQRHRPPRRRRSPRNRRPSPSTTRGLRGSRRSAAVPNCACAVCSSTTAANGSTTTTCRTTPFSCAAPSRRSKATSANCSRIASPANSPAIRRAPSMRTSTCAWIRAQRCAWARRRCRSAWNACSRARRPARSNAACRRNSRPAATSACSCRASSTVRGCRTHSASTTARSMAATARRPIPTAISNSPRACSSSRGRMGTARCRASASASPPRIGDKVGGGNNFLPRYRTPGQLTFFSYRSDVAADGTHDRWSPQTYWYVGRFGVLGEYIASRQDVARQRRQRCDRQPRLATQRQLRAHRRTRRLPRHRETRPSLRPARKRAGAHWNWSRATANSTSTTHAFPLFANPGSAADGARSWGVGLNWYLNQHFKLVANYLHTTFDGGARRRRPRRRKSCFTRAQFSF